MGKRKRFNKFIRKWIKSDLPKERSTVLLLGVTKIPTTPVPARRPCSLPLAPPNNPLCVSRRGSISNSRRNLVRRNSSKRRHQVQGACPERLQEDATPTPTTPVCIVSPNDDDAAAPVVMERSVDSIGTCSLDVEASVDLSDWSEASSLGTLRSATATPIVEPHLPSYLSLACTVNGYSTTTNYDPDRLARSRDASPHRIDPDHLTKIQNQPTYAVHNNLLSPPNLVPLPAPRTPKKMAEQTLTTAQHHHQEFYSTKTISFCSSESRFTSTVYSNSENGHKTSYQSSKCVNFENNSVSSTTNGETKCSSETILRQEYSNGKDVPIKSFIQQRVERLYGPGALAQGFFVSKRQKNRLSESDSEKSNKYLEVDKHSKSMQDKLLQNDDSELSSMKQSTSSPTLPVLRHLRPEFRAQLPIISPRKELQKSITVPKLKEQAQVNGHGGKDEVDKVPVFKCSNQSDVIVVDTPVPAAAAVKETSLGERNGHYFLQALADQTQRLLLLADQTEKELEIPNLSEEIIGKIRSASGKARLLVSQKMQQFKGLCTNNINQSGTEQFPTTNQDLQGFWDMVMLQVNQVDALFAEIDFLRKNNWKEIPPADTVDSKPVNGSKAKKSQLRPRPAATSVNEEARKQREAQRKKMLEERRKAMRAQQQSKRCEDIEIFVPESS